MRNLRFSYSGLPKFILLRSVVGAGNQIQLYLTLELFFYHYVKQFSIDGKNHLPPIKILIPADKSDFLKVF